MKRSSRVFAVLMCVFLLAVCAAGCGKGAKAKEEEITAKSLMQEIQEKTEAMSSQSTHADIVIEMGGDALSTIGGSLTMDMDLDIDTTSQPMASHIKGKLAALIMNTDVETYTVLSEDKSEILTYIRSEGKWMLQRIPFSEEDVESIDVSAKGIMENIDSITLEEETREVDGKEAYILSGTIEGESIAELMGAAGSIVGSYTGGEDVDYSGLSVDLEYAISVDEHLPLYTNMVFHGMESMLGMEEIRIDGMTMDLKYTGFNTVDAITVPQEAVTSAQEISAD